MHAEHKGPLFAFVVVAILCGVLLGQASRGDADGGLVVSSGPSSAGHPARIRGRARAATAAPSDR